MTRRQKSARRQDAPSRTLFLSLGKKVNEGGSNAMSIRTEDVKRHVVVIRTL